MNERIPVVGVADNVDPDNVAQILALMGPCFDLKCVVVTGRTVAGNPQETSFRTTLNAVRMLNAMNAARPHHSVPVFRGSPAPRALITNHIDELVFNDLLPGQLAKISEQADLRQLGLAGDASGALAFLSGQNEFSVVCGGPMTDVAHMLRNQTVAPKIRDVFCQLGKFGLGGEALLDWGDGPRGNASFNAVTDPTATHTVLTSSANVYMHPADVTRDKRIGFSDPRRLQDFLPQNNNGQVLTGLYGTWYELVLKNRGEMIFMHDLAPVLGCAALYGFMVNPYTMTPMEIVRVPYMPDEEDRLGEIHITIQPGLANMTRYVATDVDPVAYFKGTVEMLGGVS